MQPFYLKLAPQSLLLTLGKSRLWGMFLLPLLLLPQLATAQRNGCCGWIDGEGKTEIRQTNFASDWRARFEFNIYGDVGDFNEWEWETGDNWNGKHLPIFNNNGNYIGNRINYNDGYMPLGPNASVTKDIRAEFGDGSTDDNYDNIFFATSSIYGPASLSVKSIGIFRIEIEWTKGTHMPDNESKYKITLNNSVIATVDGNVRTYVLEGLQANTAYSIGVATHTDGGSHTYDNITYASWSAQTSAYRNISPTTLPFTMNASDGDYSNKVRLTWPKVSLSADNIRVERSFPGTNPVQYEELTILNKHATAYTDNGAIPGYNYTYRVSPLDENGNALTSIMDLGYQKPNGIVKGQVRALGGAGVENVQICVIPFNPVSPAGALAVPQGGYCTTTDASGSYEVRNIYYFDSATFVVVPTYQNHTFGPPSRVIILDQVANVEAGIDFSDSTAISISGKVHFPPASTFGAVGNNLIGVRGAKVLIDSLDRGIRTNADGAWSYAVSNPGTYKFHVEYEHHDFDVTPLFADATGDTAVVTIVDQDVTGVDFEDQNVDSILVKIQDGCGSPLPVQANANGSTPRVRVRSEKGPTYFEKHFSMDANGNATVILPATKFELKTVDDPPFLDPNVAAQLTDTTYSFDLTVRDSLSAVSRDTTLKIKPQQTVVVGGVTVTLPADTTYIFDEDTTITDLQPRADFTYLGPFDIQINFQDAGADVYPGCLSTGVGTANDSIILMEVGTGYNLEVFVTDRFSGCFVDSGVVEVYDFISDRENDPVEVPLKNGVSRYTVLGGEPNVASGGAKPFQKLLFVSVTAGVRDPEQKGWWILLQGAKELTPTFTSRSPELPDLVIHDPPGDNSYAWVEQGSEYSSFTDVQYEISGSAGGYGDIILGSKVKLEKGTPFFSSGTEVGKGAKIDFEVIIGRENFDRNGYRTSYSFSETFSTSSDPLFTGYDGDVYIGKALNQLYSIAKVLEFDPSNCTSSVEDRPNLEPFGISSTFIYTERHIKGVLVPQLQYLANILRVQAAKETDPTAKDDLVNEADSFLVDKVNWERILQTNAENRDQKAVFVENRSFSAGATYQNVRALNEEASVSYEYLTFIDETIKLGAAWNISGEGFWSEGKAGVAANFRSSISKETGNNSTSTFIVGYELADKDIGDFFSVDILKDTAYNVPAFRVFGGTSSCPQEAGTQARDRAKFNVFPPRQDGIEVGKTAIFRAQMINESESQEAREYQVRVIPQTNPGGATVRLGGQLINNLPISYFLDAFQATEVDLTVEKGPRAANYERIGIMMFPPCEYELWENNGNLVNGDTFFITVNFESECSSVSLSKPVNDWLVNANSNDQLIVDFTGYDLNNPYLESLSLEYKLIGQGWQDGPEIQKGDILDKIYRLFWDVSNLPDGNYEIRARANCGSGRGTTQSTALQGIIDRSSIGPYGSPTPSDGFLRQGQDIAVNFDSDIDCGFLDPTPAYTPEISLIRLDDSTNIPFTVQCSEPNDGIIIQPTVNLFNMPDLEGVTLAARIMNIKGSNGNFQKYPIEWSFQVNASPVFWDPDSLNEKGNTGANNVLASILKNQASFTKAFEITDFPAWLTPSILSGAILSNGEYAMEFAVDPDLAPGIYRDTVIAIVDGWPELLDITYESLAIPPSWQVEESNYQHSMTAVLAFSLDQTNTNLSRDGRDLIAAVVNGEVRGVANLEYIPQVDRYLAFIQIHSNAQFGETVSFRMWHALSGTEYGAVETLVFGTDQVVGRIQSPTILHPAGVFQVIPLQQGWNWVSLNVDAPNWSREKVLESIQSPYVGNQISILNKAGQLSSFAQALPPYQYLSSWSGNLFQLNNREMFLIYLSDKPDTLRVLGQPVTTPPAINLLNGWNWIGYPVQSAKPIGDALANFDWRNYDLVRSQEAFAEYYRPGNEWFGPLKFMQPGEGYKVNARNPRSNVLNYPARNGKEAYQVVGKEQYGSQMAIIGRVNLEGVSITPDRLIVGAFIDDTCRAVGELEYVELFEEYRVYMGIHGNSRDLGREVEFRIFDTYTEEVFVAENREAFIGERLLGTPNEAYELFRSLSLSEGGYRLGQNVPNPYDSRTTISYLIPQTEQVQLMVYDAMGKQVKVLINEEQQAGEHSFTFDASDLPAGIYHYSLRAGDFQASRKMVKF